MSVAPGQARFAAQVSNHPDPAFAVAEAVGDVAERVGMAPDLCVVFVSGPFIAAMDDLLDVVRTVLAPTHLLAVSAAGLLGGGREIEQGGSLSLWAGRTGPVEPVRLRAMPGAPPVLVGLDPPPAGSTLLLLADPFTTPVDAVFDAVGPGVEVVGGLASSGRAPGGNVLVLDDETHTDGAIGVVLPPGVAGSVVSQGCRPIGDPWVVTEVEGQRLLGLGGRPAMERLREVVDGLSPGDRFLASQGLHLGVVARDRADDFRRGDFLIRGVLGADRDRGAIVVGDHLEVGQVVQFQVRDAGSARDDLGLQASEGIGSGALVFTCNGRGSHLFDDGPNDASILNELHPEVAVAGMFCAGEIGPVDRRNAIHGFTATICTFE